jgi:hypothetical protein
MIAEFVGNCGKNRLNLLFRVKFATNSYLDVT